MTVDNLDRTSYCGLYCGRCAFGNGSIPDLARDLRKEMRSFRLEQAADIIPFPEFKHYRECYDLLGTLVKMRCGGCRAGSRSKFCEVARCAKKNGYDGCWECDDLDSCDRLAFLEHVHGDGHRRNLRKIRRSGLDAWVEAGPCWYAPPKKK